VNQGTLAAKPIKTQYSVSEAAQELGLSVEQLRTLIRSHIAETDEDLNNVAVTSFHPSDLLILKLLAAQNGNSTPQGSEA
jgi:hypothetical protein